MHLKLSFIQCIPLISTLPLSTFFLILTCFFKSEFFPYSLSITTVPYIDTLSLFFSLILTSKAPRSVSKKGLFINTKDLIQIIVSLKMPHAGVLHRNIIVAVTGCVVGGIGWGGEEEKGTVVRPLGP